jgi:hypothetical protein
MIPSRTKGSIFFSHLSLLFSPLERLRKKHKDKELARPTQPADTLLAHDGCYDLVAWLYKRAKED